jgi:hypothetical protein
MTDNIVMMNNTLLKLKLNEEIKKACLNAEIKNAYTVEKQYYGLSKYDKMINSSIRNVNNDTGIYLFDSYKHFEKTYNSENYKYNDYAVMNYAVFCVKCGNYKHFYQNKCQDKDKKKYQKKYESILKIKCECYDYYKKTNNLNELLKKIWKKNHFNDNLFEFHDQYNNNIIIPDFDWDGDNYYSDDFDDLYP